MDEKSAEDFKQKKLDFFFTPKSDRLGSPDLSNFTSRRKTVGSTSDACASHRRANIEEDVMEEDDEWCSSDEEPIINRKRQTKLHRSPEFADTKRHKDEAEDSSAMRGTPSVTKQSPLDEKLLQWTPEKSLRSRKVMDEEIVTLHQGSSSFASGAVPVVITGLEKCSEFKGKHYGDREVKLFPFLLEENIRDACGRKMTDEDYDPSTVMIPASWFDKNKVSEGQKQWWAFKAANFDALLLFKVGKFYELYEMDAHAAVEALDLKYMKGDQPHCGFPEGTYTQMAAALASKGYKVVVIEQTETPEQLKKRNEALKKQNKNTAKVVAREKVAVLTKGTMRETEMIQQQPDANYLMSIIESRTTTGTYMVGFCAVDAASSQFLLSQFEDDALTSILRTHLSILQPVELILPDSESGIRDSVKRTIQKIVPDARINKVPCNVQGFPIPSLAASVLKSYFAKMGPEKISQELQEVLENTEKDTIMLSAAGAIINFLKTAMLDDAIIPISKFSILKSAQDSAAMDFYHEPEFIFLDSSAFENLEIFSNSDGGLQGSLLSFLDHCVTPFGKRILRNWICTPLGRICDIEKRQLAVQDLCTVAETVTGQCRKQLSAVGDLERAIIRLHSSVLDGAPCGREAYHVILYEDPIKKKVKALSGALSGLQLLNQTVQSFQPIRDRLQSLLLLGFVSPGEKFPLMDQVLAQLLAAADWNEAEKTGRVIPAKGIVPEYDRAQERVKELESCLDAFLENLREKISAHPHEVYFSALKKDKYLVEMDERLMSKIPTDFELVSQRKGFKRYTCFELKSLIKELEQAENHCEEELRGVLHGLVQEFVSHQELWTQALDCIGQLDALMSLAIASCSVEGPVCLPKLVPYSTDTIPIFKATKLRHPCLSSNSISGNFIPNDVQLGGGEEARILVLTGANMGGKSTLLRQVCIATIMAQIGAFVPAASMELTPVDCIFVRMGARDNIMCGQSTFYVELSDTASMLRRATRRSIVALDELGRGTATHDGESIASAVLQHLISVIKCRGMFATHYHALAKQYEHNGYVSVKHMACLLTPRANSGPLNEDEDSEDIVDVTFLYQLANGVSPKSYGMNVARLAGIPESVIKSANQISSAMDKKWASPASAYARERLVLDDDDDVGHSRVHALTVVGNQLKGTNVETMDANECQELILKLKGTLRDTSL